MRLELLDFPKKHVLQQTEIYTSVVMYIKSKACLSG